MDTSVLEHASNEFAKLTNKPEHYLKIQDTKAESTKTLLKTLYDGLKCEETRDWSVVSALPELIVEEFDVEQIWQELCLQNDGINDRIVKDVAVLLSKKDRLAFELAGEENQDADGDEENDLDAGSEIDEEINEEIDEEDEEEIEDDENDDEDDDRDISASDDENSKPAPKLKFKSELDDDFFKLCDMENFCDEVEKEEKEGQLDLFDGGDDSGEERELWRYNDFFTDGPKGERGGGKGGKRGVRFAEEQFSDEEEEEEIQTSQVSEESEPKKSENDSETTGPKSTFEARQERLKARIETLEDEAMKDKPWFLKGEVTSSGRPQNSLLQEYVEFDRAARPAPIFTEKTTLRLEDIIRQRIKDKAWDDVERKIKPVEDPREFRKRLVLDQEKSKVSLAQIYEQEFIKQRDAAAGEASGDIPEDKPEPEEHQDIRKMMAKLFAKLDALSNFHYTPKMVNPEIKIISNLPAIAMEDVAPISTSDATLLAPEEIKNKPTGELMSKAERTETDKKRERRKKKQLQRAKQKESKKKDKVISKMSLGLGNKYSKERAKKELDRLTKDRNIERMDENQVKVRSSTAFFGKLEDQTKGVKKGVQKRKKIVNNVSAKRIKL